VSTSLRAPNFFFFFSFSLGPQLFSFCSRVPTTRELRNVSKLVPRGKKDNLLLSARSTAANHCPSFALSFALLIDENRNQRNENFELIGGQQQME